MISPTAREEDLSCVRRLLDAAARPGITLLSGPQGVGKTLLVRHLLAEPDAPAHLYLDIDHVRSIEELGWALLTMLEPRPCSSGALELQNHQHTTSDTETSAQLYTRIADLLVRSRAVLVLDHLGEELWGRFDKLCAMIGAGQPGFTGCMCITHQEVVSSAHQIELGQIHELDSSTLHMILKEELSPRRHAALRGDEATSAALDEIVALCMGRPLWLVIWCRRLELMGPKELLDAIHQGKTIAHGEPHTRLIEGLRAVMPEAAWSAWIECSVFEQPFPVTMGEQVFGEDLLEPLELLREHGILEVVDTPEEVMCRIHPMCRSHVCRADADSRTLEMLTRARTKHDMYFLAQASERVDMLRGAFDDERVSWFVQHRRALSMARSRLLEQSVDVLALEQALVLVALSRGDWQGAFEMSSRWRVGEQHLSAHDWSAPIWLDVSSRSDEPMRGLEFAQSWLACAPEREKIRDQVEAERVRALTLGMIVRAAEIASWLERTSVIEPLVARGLELARGPAYRIERGRLLLVNALMLIHARDWFAAQAMCQEAAHLFGEMKHVRLMGKTAYHLGHIFKNLWKGEQSLEEYERALRYAGASQDVYVLAQTYRELAWLWLDRAQVERAEAQIEKFDALTARHTTSWMRGVSCMLRGQVAMQRGEYEGALVELEASRWHLASSQQRYMLAATLYFEFLCYWARGEFDQARVYMQLGDGMSDQITSIMALTCYDCARIVMSLHDGQLEQAEQILAQSRARHDESRSRSWLGSLLDVHAFHIELTRYLLLPRHNSRKARALAAEIGARGVDLQSRYDRGGLVTDFNAEVRLCWGIMTAQLPEAIEEQIELGMIDPSGEAFIIDRGQHTFRAPHSATWVDMSRREVPFRLLCALVDQRVESPGEPLDAAELFERVWPGESILQESAQNRLYVTIASLRKEGLRTYLSSVQGGYLLDAEMRLIEV